MVEVKYRKNKETSHQNEFGPGATGGPINSEGRIDKVDLSTAKSMFYEHVTDREAGVRYLKEQLSIPVVERVLSEERKNPRSLLDNLPNERCCVQFYDLEAALPEATGYLNLHREHYADVPHALVFWVGEHGLREIVENAPDFWAWRSGVFEARSESPDVAHSVSQVALGDDVRFTNRGDLERRAQLYEGLIQEYEEKDEEYVAQLRLKLVAILYWLRRLERAEQEAQKAREYAEREVNEELAARAYHSLGMIAQERRDFEEAEKWYRRSVEIEERQGNEHGAASTYHQMGMIAQERGKPREAGEWSLRALQTFTSANDSRRARMAAHQFATILEEAPSGVQDDLRQQWIDAGLPEDELDDLLDQVRAEKSG